MYFSETRVDSSQRLDFLANEHPGLGHVLEQVLEVLVSGSDRLDDLGQVLHSLERVRAAQEADGLEHAECRDRVHLLYECSQEGRWRRRVRDGRSHERGWRACCEWSD